MSIILTIGRLPDNDIVLAESYISGHHAQLIRDADGKWFINDLQSSNGTFVNGERITGPKEIKETDQILLGGSLLNLKDIYQQYKTPAQPALKYKSKKVHYLLGLGAAIILFGIFFLANEFYFTPVRANTNTEKKDPDKNKDKSGTKKDTDNKTPEHITYDLSCVTYSDNQQIDKLANKLDSLETNYINKSGVTVSLEEEINFGDENHQGLLKGSTVINDDNSYHLKGILEKLASRIPEPRGFHYQFFLINSKEINSWTSGGRIYFTTAMLNFTKNDDEIAGILGHEINHNELYHINDMLKAQKLAAQKLGDRNGNVISTVNKVLTSPFGKKDEAHCDLKGEDLVIGAGYDPCAVIKLWSRMASKEGEHSNIDNFLRSHPYANIRIACIENHLNTNYNISCK